MLDNAFFETECSEKSIEILALLGYDGGNTTSGGARMNANRLLRAALEAVGSDQSKASEKMGWTKNKLYGLIHRDTLRANDFLAIMDAIGVDVILKDRETGKTISERITGLGPRVKQMVDFVKYDTANADAMATSFYADGVNMYNDEGKATELYLDADGRYFFAEYTNWEGGKNRISPTTPEIAAAFIQKYGTEIHSKVPNTD